MTRASFFLINSRQHVNHWATILITDFYDFSIAHNFFDRIIVDAVFNHMTGLGRSPPGTAGSDFNADSRDTLYFPAVPYDVNSFTPKSECPSSSGNCWFI